MRALLFVIAALLLICLFIPLFKGSNISQDTVLHKMKQPFDQRLHFKIGTVDPRFNLSHQQLIQLSEEAIQIWQNGSGKSLLVYDPNAKLSINLVFDQRQMEHQALKQNQQDLDTIQSNNQQSSQELDQRFQYLQNRHDELEKRRDQITQAFENLNQQRQSWVRIENQDGPNRQRIEQEYQQLKLQADQLDQDIHDLKIQNAEYNQNVQQHNQNIDLYNVNVTHFNQRFAAREFHKGIFNGKHIEIYQFDTVDDLRLTIAHELGHALGLAHNTDPEALMYPVLGAQNYQNFRLKSADLAMLKDLK